MAIKLFRHYWHVPLVLLALIELSLQVVTPSIVSWVIATTAADVPAIPGVSMSYQSGAIAYGLCIFLGMVAMGLHNIRQRSRLLGLTGRVLLGALGGTLAFTFLATLFGVLRIDYVVLLWSLPVVSAVGILLRLLFERVINAERFKRRIVVYGAGRMAGSIATLRRRSDRRGFTICGYFRSPGDVQIDLPEARIFDAENLLDVCQRFDVDEIVVAMDDRRQAFPMDQLLECRLDGVDIVDLVTFLERETGKVRLDVLNPSWMIYSDGFRQGQLHGMLERTFDVAASLLLVTVTLPVMLLTVIAIKLEEGLRAPVLYRQTRVGQCGRTFKLMKFRSMRIDAEREGKPIWAAKNDSRITSVGGFIRKTRIDELPQILNVLRGEMSFVGPRPERPEFVSQLNERIPYYRERHTIKPGLTGWAQLCYPYGSSEQDAVEKLQYDLFYVKNHSPLFYLAILVQTVEVIVWGKGAR